MSGPALAQNNKPQDQAARGQQKTALDSASSTRDQALIAEATTLEFHIRKDACGSLREIRRDFRIDGEGNLQMRFRSKDGNDVWLANKDHTTGLECKALYLDQGKVYDAEGTQVHSVQWGKNSNSTSVQDMLRYVEPVQEGKLSGVRDGWLKEVRHEGKQVVFTRGTPPALREANKSVQEEPSTQKPTTEPSADTEATTSEARQEKISERHSEPKLPERPKQPDQALPSSRIEFSIPNQRGHYQGIARHLRLGADGSLQMKFIDSNKNDVWLEANDRKNGINCACLFHHQGKLYDASGKVVDKLVWGKAQQISAQEAVRCFDPAKEGQLSGVRDGLLKDIRYDGKQVVLTAGVPPALRPGATSEGKDPAQRPSKSNANTTENQSSKPQSNTENPSQRSSRQANSSTTDSLEHTLTNAGITAPTLQTLLQEKFERGTEVENFLQALDELAQSSSESKNSYAKNVQQALASDGSQEHLATVRGAVEQFLNSVDQQEREQSWQVEPIEQAATTLERELKSLTESEPLGSEPRAQSEAQKPEPSRSAVERVASGSVKVYDSTKEQVETKTLELDAEGFVRENGAVEKMAAVYFHNNKAYLYDGREVTHLEWAGSSYPIEQVKEHLNPLQEGELSGVQDQYSKNLSIMDYQVVFTKGVPPGLRSAQAASAEATEGLATPEAQTSASEGRTAEVQQRRSDYHTSSQQYRPNYQQNYRPAAQQQGGFLRRVFRRRR